MLGHSTASLSNYLYLRFKKPWTKRKYDGVRHRERSRRMESKQTVGMAIEAFVGAVLGVIVARMTVPGSGLSSG